MRAVGYQIPQSIDAETALVNFDLPRPEPTGRDILVEVKAVSVNPADTKIRASAKPEPGQWKVLGWDAAGIVTAVGPKATLFKPGDEVFYAGAINRSGTNAEYHLVDERIVGKKPATLDFSAAAALPLTSITAWEMLFDRLDVSRPVPGAANAILIIGGAGGVGSIAIQIVRALTNLTVIATASRPETQDWVKALGAHHVIDHRKPLAAQVAALGVGQPAFVFSTTNTDDHLSEIIDLIAPQGRLGLIDDPRELSALPLKRKSISLHWELMFTRSLYATADIEKQHELLNRIGALVDEGRIKSTLNESFGAINAENLKRAHALIESGKAKGKIVLAGF
ncbi:MULTISPECIES: zinc-binding alcohol dehydrogenase family protein [Rhizobium/Agrobacterium group]|uniref:zinc-binding alcohol dehydrogenase family protein n=1 Tax=Rhizobium/Agrobacterium group TaxID=227290 RepID=UPI002300D3F4|nr:MULTISPECIES: zinc-binding alcohol dehydrogenase family protein [Rhizobium/Agrobacterium group]MDA5635005.1 zinc-binding alcohol dehydrogenase family protein [Agrobacterium sp. ST15.16.024]MDF1890153.1 zinc-binding alcohol dehydrogenase family protein [Rhizobium rhizogenes]